jgi:predicted GNAT family N-acyltransferase
MSIREIRIDHSTIIKPFDCGDEDLNEFLLEKSNDYEQELLAIIFVFEDEVKTLAYYSLFNDSLKIEDISFPSKNAVKNFLRRLFPHPKRHLNHYPAIKVGRLAISMQTQKLGLGRTIMDTIIDYAIKQNERCACKFILVDAYKEALGFYEKMNFEYFSENDLDDATRQMYLNLTPLINARRENNPHLGF